MLGLSSQMQISGLLNGECINALIINSNQENLGTDKGW